MADLIRMGGVVGIPKDRLGSPSSGSDDEGVGVDLADLAHELDADEFDGPLLVNGESDINCLENDFRIC